MSDRRTPEQEAASYRRRLRETERQRDDLAAQLATVRAQLIQAETDRFTAGLLRGDGSIDVMKLRQDLAQHLTNILTKIDTP